MHQLGEKYSYLRVSENGEVSECVGILKAVFLQDGREMAQFRDCETSTVHNVYAHGIDYTSEVLSEFRDVFGKIQRLTDDGNSEIKKVQAYYQERVDDLYDAMLGVKIDAGE